MINKVLLRGQCSYVQDNYFYVSSDLSKYNREYSSSDEFKVKCEFTKDTIIDSNENLIQYLNNISRVSLVGYLDDNNIVVAKYIRNEDSVLDPKNIVVLFSKIVRFEQLDGTLQSKGTDVLSDIHNIYLKSNKGFIDVYIPSYETKNSHKFYNKTIGELQDTKKDPVDMPHFNVSISKYLAITGYLSEPLSNNSDVSNTLHVFKRDDIPSPYYIKSFGSSPINDSKFHNDLINVNSLHYESTDNNILNNIYNLELKYNVYYKFKDLINFHVSMKTNGITILAGPSGIGKTRLVRLYAQALGIYNKTQFNHIAVNPLWRDDTDLLGYFDPVKGLYYPSNSGLVDTLNEAYHNPHKLYIILLDEMNLANVDHYLSDILSIMDYKDGDMNKCVKLFDNNSFNKLSSNNNGVYESTNHYPSKIPVFNNVLFVGTINTDESTYKLSDRILDRSSIIHLTKDSFNHPYKKDLKNKSNSDMKVIPCSYDSWKSICNENNDKLSSYELNCLDDFNYDMNKTNHILGVGWRIKNQINDYLTNMPNNNQFNIKRSDALDLEFVQKIFNKIVGNKKQLQTNGILLDIDKSSISQNKNANGIIGCIGTKDIINTDNLPKNIMDVFYSDNFKNLINNKLVNYTDRYMSLNKAIILTYSKLLISNNKDDSGNKFIQRYQRYEGRLEKVLDKLEKHDSNNDKYYFIRSRELLHYKAQEIIDYGATD